ncbi:hypothetical protein [Arsenicibacter rosenii]|uniref:DUF4369 domain-containing protein n=1 Tax=Arsenicibacter rosenii TaxID=1750698 RepID=A0A1S2VPQ3_9BACT|nr:hypothetical protein [Arsenicibacter rosenii]OIN60215.1 hypothetical protein BLX24_05105 [Arsenicibacter rosenii]
MKTYILFTLLWVTAAGTCLAKDDIAWKTGKLQLNNGAEMAGSLNYNWKAEVLQLKLPDGTIKAFSPSQVRSFMYFDENANDIRQFASVDFPVRRSTYRPVFLETITTGVMTVYRRLRHAKEPLRLSSTASYGNDDQLIKDYDNFNYVVYTNDTFIPLDEFNGSLWPQIQTEFGAELKAFVKARELDTENTMSRLMMITQYNLLKEAASSTTTARGQAEEATPISVD